MAATPQALVVHASAGRLRLRIPAMRGDGAFFRRVRQALVGQCGAQVLTTRVLTGSLLAEGPALDPGALLRLAGQLELFHVEQAMPPAAVRSPLRLRVGAAIRRLDARLQCATCGELDLETLAMLGSLAAGAAQLGQGRTPLPSWHSALWYAVNFGRAALSGEAPADTPDDGGNGD